MHKQSEPHRIHLEILNGQLYARLAEFWLKYVGYSSLAAGITIAEQLESSWLLSAARWLSYLAIYLWLNYVVDSLFFYTWPDLNLRWGSRKPKKWHLIISNVFSLPLVFLAIIFAIKLSEAITIANS